MEKKGNYLSSTNIVDASFREEMGINYQSKKFHKTGI